MLNNLSRAVLERSIIALVITVLGLIIALAVVADKLHKTTISDAPVSQIGSGSNGTKAVADNSPLSKYNIYPKSDLPSDPVLFTMSGVSLDAAIEKCNATPGCVGFVFQQAPGATVGDVYARAQATTLSASVAKNTVYLKKA